MRVGIGQINTWAGDIDRNLASILQMVDEAKSAGCDVVVFPEYAIPGAFPLDLVRRPGFVSACEEANETVRQASEDIDIVLGSVARETSPSAGICSSAFHFAGGDVGLRADKTLLRSWPFDETTRFAPGQGACTTELGGHTIGLALHDLDRLSASEMDLFTGLGADWLLVSSSTHFRGGKRMQLLPAVCQAARETGVGIAFANGVGGADGIVLEGGSFAVNPKGELIFEGARFKEAFYAVDFEAPAVDAIKEDRIGAARSAIVLAIRDYVRKSGHQKVVVGVSGGVDSALVAALAVEALGPEAVLGIYLPCAYSSEESRRDAHELASRLRFELQEVSACSTHDAFREALPFEAAGVVDENLQARARAVLWMAMANKQHALVLAAGNKSEAAVGYATLYGDTTGALAPIADLYKTDVFQMARSFGDRIPNAILTKAPSAELRPNQRDEDELPPYEELDRLLRAYLDEGASRENLLRDHTPIVIEDVLRRVERSEFKRRQVPPAVLLSESPLSRHQLPLSRRIPGPTASE